MKSLIFCLFVLFLVNENSAALESFSDDELVALLNAEKFVVVLFTKNDCKTCEEFETALTNIREDLVDQLNAYVIKAEKSMFTSAYNPDKEPVIVFFRHGIPLLYDGPVNEELILHTITDNQDPVVRELTDDTFEHLTQASTGATTGDWFIMFYETRCVECLRIQARWETTAAKLKTRLNVARVNCDNNGRVTSRRFDIVEMPTFILFRQGKMYRYNINKYDIQSFTSFATLEYKNVESEDVPEPNAAFNDLSFLVTEYLRQNPWIWKLGSLTLLCGIAASIVYKLNKRDAERKKVKNPVKKSDKVKKVK